jgi:hypothetical protein
MGKSWGPSVGGSYVHGCKQTGDGKPTILAHLQEYQRHMVAIRSQQFEKKNTIPPLHVLQDVRSIEIQAAIALVSK